MQPPSIVNEDGWVNVEDLSPHVTLYRNIGVEEARYVSDAVRDVRTFAVIDVKGGVKKTTAAVHIAHGLYRAGGGPVLLGDSDKYQSVTDWAEEAAREDEEEGKFADPWPDEMIVVPASGDNFHFELVDAVKKHRPKYMGIDTPPNDQDAAKRALLMADVMIMPTGPFEMDIRRLSYGLEVAIEVEDLRGRPIYPLALLTGVKMGSNLYRDARAYLRDMGVKFVPMPIRDMVAHAKAFGTSLPKLNDYDPISDDLVPLLDDIHKEK